MKRDKKTCPVCDGNLEFMPSKDILSKFPTSEDDKNGYFICTSCGRSLGLGPNEEPIKRSWQ